MQRHLAEAVQRLGLRGERVLVAVSGGIDSVCLLDGLRAGAADWGLALEVGHVNHGLRGAESEADEHFVGELAARHGLECSVERIEPRALREGCSSRDRPTLQEAARLLRRAALERIAARTGATRIATAHHADDQAETLLLRILRGSGPEGLRGIAERSGDGRWVRPLLRVPRAMIEEHARARRIAWREDSSNASRDYARNRLRRDWMPGLARDFNPQLVRALGGLAEAQRCDSDWIESQVDAEWERRFRAEGRGWRIDARGWSELAPALSRRLLRRALGRCGAGRLLSRSQIERADAFLSNARRGGTLELAGDLRLRCEAGSFRLAPHDTSGADPAAC